MNKILSFFVLVVIMTACTPADPIKPTDESVKTPIEHNNGHKNDSTSKLEEGNKKNSAPKAKEKHVSKVILQGSLQGAGKNYQAAGGVKIEERKGEYYYIFDKNFSYTQVPDPVLYLGNDGERDDTTAVGPISLKGGEGEVRLPKDLDPRAFNELFLHCREYNIPIGSAKLK